MGLTNQTGVGNTYFLPNLVRKRGNTANEIGRDAAHEIKEDLKGPIKRAKDVISQVGK
jgi:hypothetical protein